MTTPERGSSGTTERSAPSPVGWPASLPWQLVFAGALAVGCGGHASRERSIGAMAPPSSMGAAAAPRARVVAQPFVYNPGRGLTITPDRIWEWEKTNGVTFYDWQTPFKMGSHVRPLAIDSLPIALLPTDVAITEDGADAILLLLDSRQARSGRFIADYEGMRVLERWSLATRTRRWTQELSPTSIAIPYSFDSSEQIMLSKRGLFVTRCIRSPQNRCEVTSFNADTGAPGPTSVFGAPPPIDPEFDRRRVVSAHGRYALRLASGGWRVFDDTGRIAGVVRAKCVRFEGDDSAARPGLLIDQETGPNDAAASLFTLKRDARACVKAPYEAVGQDLRESYIMWAGAGDRVVWQDQETQVRFANGNGTREPDPRLFAAYSLDVGQKGLPAALPAPSEKNEYAELFSVGSELYAAAGKRVVRLKEGHFVPDSEGQREGHWRLAHTYGNDVLLPSGPEVFSMALGTRRPTGAGWSWLTINSQALYDPGLVLFEDGGRKQALISTGKWGLIRADAQTGNVLQRTCSLGARPTGICNPGDGFEHYIGLLGTSSGKAAWTFHQVMPKVGGAVLFSFEEIDPRNGKTLRSFPAPRAWFDGPADYKMEWIEPDRRFWFHRKLWGQGMACVTFVTVPAEERGEPSYDGFCVEERLIRGFAADPKGRYFASFRSPNSVDIFAPDGARVLTIGTLSIYGDGAFAQSRDGRFACTGSACEMFQCVVGDVGHPVTHPACAALREPGFSVLEELARPIQKR